MYIQCEYFVNEILFSTTDISPVPVQFHSGRYCTSPTLLCSPSRIQLRQCSIKQRRNRRTRERTHTNNVQNMFNVYIKLDIVRGTEKS